MGWQRVGEWSSNILFKNPIRYSKGIDCSPINHLSFFFFFCSGGRYNPLAESSGQLVHFFHFWQLNLHGSFDCITEREKTLQTDLLDLLVYSDWTVHVLTTPDLELEVIDNLAKYHVTNALLCICIYIKEAKGNNSISYLSNLHPALMFQTAEFQHYLFQGSSQILQPHCPICLTCWIPILSTSGCSITLIAQL